MDGHMPRKDQVPGIHTRVLTHPEKRQARENDREQVDAEHHLELVDLVLLEDAVLPLRGETVTHQVDRNEKQAQPLSPLLVHGTAALGEGEHAHTEGDGNRLKKRHRITHCKPRTSVGIHTPHRH